MKTYIGYDQREKEASLVAAHTLSEQTQSTVPHEFLDEKRLRDVGLLTRVSDYRGSQDYDLISNAHASTRFAVSRFLTPIICQQGYALFVDADVVFLRDPREMLLDVDRNKAVSVVKHTPAPTEQWKMVNQRQSSYSRKNWSSVMLFNCDHPANRRLTVADVNTRRGIDLHNLYWLNDAEIGELHPRWNWLVDVEEKPFDGVGIAHFTLGGPWIDGWVPKPSDSLWLQHRVPGVHRAS